jgi:hypothetical protein
MLSNDGIFEVVCFFKGEMNLCPFVCCGFLRVDDEKELRNAGFAQIVFEIR